MDKEKESIALYPQMKLLFCSDISWESTEDADLRIAKGYIEGLSDFKELKPEDFMSPCHISDPGLKKKVIEMAIHPWHILNPDLRKKVAEIIKNKKYEFARENVQKIIKVIKDEKPDGIFLLGDIIDDGSCHFSHENELYDVLKWINSKHINTFLIQGNHDYYSEDEYKQLISKIEDFGYIHEISGKKAIFHELSILGVPFETTDHLGMIKKFVEENKHHNFDFVIAHSHYRRRIWLTDLPTKYIVTGHFGQGYHFSPEGRLLLSTDGFPYSYLTFDLSANKAILNYGKSLLRKTGTKIELILKEKGIQRIMGDKKFIEDLEKRRKEEETKLRTLKEAKYQFHNLHSDAEKRGIIKILFENGVPITHVREYIKDQEWIRGMYKKMKRNSN